MENLRTTSLISLLDWQAKMRFIFWDEFAYTQHVYPCRRAIALLRALGGYDENHMATGKRGQPFTQVEFVQISLSGDDEKAFHKWATEHGETAVQDISYFIAEDMKLGITWDTANNCFITSATCKDEKSPNSNRCMTARSDDWYEALMLLVYKHQVIAKKGDWSLVSKPASWG